MRNIVIAAAFAASLATPAMAQDKAPFTGLRAEGVAGWDRVSDEDGSSDGVLYGAQIGYDVQAGGAIVGVEGEVTGATTDLSGGNLLVPGDRIEIGAGRDLYVGARVGLAVSPRAMVYAKGGFSNARIETDYTSGTFRVQGGENAGGYRVGAGAEYQLSGNTYLKGEYRYSNYGRIAGESIDLDRHQVLGGIGVRF